MYAVQQYFIVIKV